MPEYRYSAVSGPGRIIRGTRTASDEQDLFEKLKNDGQYLTWAKEKRAKPVPLRPLKARQLAQFCQELGTLLGAGISLVHALAIISQDEELKAGECAAYTGVLHQLRQGAAFSDALERQKNVFPPLMIFMVRSAETAGNMEKTVKRLAVQFTKEHRMNTKIKNSAVYPKLLSAVIAVVVYILAGYVLPQFDLLFSMMEELPLPTRILFGITDFLSERWPAVLATAAAVLITARAACMVPGIRMQVDRFKLHMPVSGRLRRMVCTARFARTLSSLYAAGVPIMPGMQIARKTIGNAWIDRQFDEAITILRTGGDLSRAVGMIDGFSKRLAFVVKIGEESGNLVVMLESMAEALEYDSEAAADRMASYLEPMLIIVMAVIVGFIMIAVMMPIYASYSVIESAAYQ